MGEARSMLPGVGDAPAIAMPVVRIAEEGTVVEMRGDDSHCLSPDLLVAFQQGRLDADRRALLTRHLAECPKCSSLMEILSRIESQDGMTEAEQAPFPDASHQTMDIDPTGGSRPVNGDRTNGSNSASLVNTSFLPRNGATDAALAGTQDLTRGRAPAAKVPLQGPEPGRLLGPYHLLEKIGAGGMGIVYGAYDQERDARVALKILPKVDGKTLYLFKREFRALADLFHPNLVTLYEFACESGYWFFTMELVDGCDFFTYVRPEVPDLGMEADTSIDGPESTVHDEPMQPLPEGTEPMAARAVLAKDIPSTRRDPDPPPEATEPDAQARDDHGPPPPRVLDIERLRASIRQLAEGVEALHAAGKLHRDLKPSNVMVTRNGRVVLLDFGLIAELTIPAFADGAVPGVDETPSHYGDSSLAEIAGTISYMAPEQAAPAVLTEACDWYAVGVILYESLTGRKPFVGSSLKLIWEKLSDTFPPSTLNPAVPPDLDSLCVDLLRRRPEERPPGAEVLRRLGTSSAAATAPCGERTPTLRRTPFIGRERQMAVLKDAYDAVKSGRVVTVLAHGVSGAGKSALFQRFVETLPASDAPVVLAGRCFEQESVPYKALDSLVDALARHLHRLPPAEAAELMPRDIAALTRIFPVLNLAGTLPGELTTPDPQELRRRAFAALRALLARIASRRTLVLAIDDLQWGDVDSALLLAELLRPPDPPPLLLLIAYRSEYATTSPCLRTLLGAWADPDSGPDRRELLVEAMRPSEAVELTLRLIGHDDAGAREFAETVARESGGNPYFISELVEQAGAGADLAAVAGSAGRIDFDEMVWRRIGGLPEGSRRLLEAIAVAGRPLTLRCASGAVGAASEAARPDAALRSGHLIRGTGPRLDDEIETYHDRIRETVVAHLPRRRALRHWHGRLATALEEAGQADVETLAASPRGGPARLDRAGSYFASRADQAAEGAAFDRAAEMLPPLDPPSGLRPAPEKRRALRTKLADALANAGRGPEAAEQYLAAAEGADRRESIDLERKAAFQYCMSGHLDEGQAVLRGVLRRVGMALPRTRGGGLASLILHRLRLQVRGLGYRERPSHKVPESILEKIDVSWSVAAGLATKDPIVAPAFQSRNLLLALRAGEPLRLVRALAWEAAHNANVGASSWSRTKALYDAAKEVALRCDEPYVRGFIDLAGSVLAFHGHRWKEGAELGERAGTIFREQCTGAAWELGQANTFLLWCMSWMGEYTAMSRRSALILEEAETKGDLFTGANLGGYVQPLGLLARGEPDESR